MIGSGKRKVLLINPRFQITFMGYIVLIAALCIAVIYSANLYFFWKFENLGLMINLPSDHVFFRFITEQKAVMNTVFALTSLGVFVALAVGGLFLSHRVAGPMYRLGKHMEDTVKGSVSSEVSFREKDFFPELATKYNDVLRHFRNLKH